MVRRFNRTQTERNEKKISAQSYSHTVRQSAKMNEYSKVGYPLQGTRPRGARKWRVRWE